MSESLNITLKPSKSYFILSTLLYLLTLFVAWKYAFNWYYFNRRILLLTNNAINAIKEINLTKDLIKTTNNHRQTYEYPQVYCAYQFRFLVIVTGDF